MRKHFQHSFTHKNWYLTLVLLLVVAVGAVWGQSPSVIPSPTNWFVGSNTPDVGALDPFTVVFLSVPDSVSPSTYIHILAESPGGGTGNNPDTGYGSGNTVFTVYGGTSAYSNLNARKLRGLVADYDTGTQLAQRTFTTENVGWYSIGSTQVGAGEHIGSRYYFKILVYVASTTVGKNAFRIDVSYATITDATVAAPTGIAGFNFFAYSWPMQLLNAINPTIYPFVPNLADAKYLVIGDWDADANVGSPGEGSTFNLNDKTGTTLVTNGALSLNNTHNRNSYLIAAATQNGTWTYQINSLTALNNTNPAEFFAYINTSADDNVGTNNDGVLPSNTYNLTPIYSSPLAIGPTPYRVVLSPSTLTAVSDGSANATISVYVLDNNGDLVQESVSVYLTLSPGTDAIFNSSNNSPGLGTLAGQTTLVTTDGFGSAWVRISRSGTPGTTTVTPTTDGSNGSTSLPGAAFNTNAVISFTNGTAPSFASPANQNFNINTSPTLPTLTITAGTAAILTGSQLRVRIPAGLNASFDVSVLTATLAGGEAANVNNPITYSAANTVAQLTTTGNFSSGGVLTIAGLRFNGLTTPASGKLQFSWDGGATWVDDPYLIFVNDPNALTWTGATNNDWNTASNWSPATVPTAASNVTLPPGSTVNLSAAGLVNTITINAGATLATSTHNLTVSGNFTNAGAFSQTSGVLTFNGAAAQTVAPGVSTFGAVTISNVVGVQNSAAWTVGNLTVNGQLTLAANLVTNNLTIGAANNLNVSASNYSVTVNGNWTNNNGLSGFTAQNGMVTFSNAVTTTHSITGNTTFYNLSSTAAGTAGGASLVFTAGSTTALAVGGIATLLGTDGAHRLALASSSSPTQWTFNLPVAAHTLTWLNISDSIRTGGVIPVPTNTISSNTSNWGLTSIYTWTGSAAATVWNNTGNWMPAGIPANGDSIIVSVITGVNFPIMPVTVTSLLNVTLNNATSVLDLAGNPLTITGTYSATVAAATLRLTGVATLTGFPATIPATVEYYGTAATLSAGSSYNNLRFASGVNWALSAPTTIASAQSLTIAAAAQLNLNGQTLTAAGATINNSGTLLLSGPEIAGTPTINNLASSTVRYVGTNPASATAGLSYVNLEVALAAGSIPLSGIWTVSGNLTISAGTLVMGTYNLSVTGNLLIGTGTIANLTQGTGSLTVTGATTINVGAANDVTLSDAGNNFSTVIATSVRDLTITDINAIVFSTASPSTISGSLMVIAGGSITDGGTIAVIGTATFETRAVAGFAAITLDDDGAPYSNTFGNLTLRTMNAAGAAAVATNITVFENAAIGISDITSNGTVTLNAAGAITDVATPSITMASGTLVLTATGLITLDDDADLTYTNNIANFGAISAGGAISIYTSSTTSFVGAILAPAASNIFLHAASGNLTTTVAGTITTSTTGTITLVADDMVLGAAVSTGSGAVFLQPVTNGTITLSGPGGLGLTAAEINQVSTTGTVQIGSPTAGAISIAANTALTGTKPFLLRSNAGISGIGVLTANNLAFSAGNTVNISTVAQTLAGTSTTGTITVGNNRGAAQTLLISTVAGIVGLTTTGAASDISLTETTGSIQLNQDINVGTNVLTLSSAQGISQTASNNILGGGSLRLLGNGTVNLTLAGNQSANLAANLGGTASLSYTDTDAFTVATVSATDGITTASGAVTLGAAAGNISINVADPLLAISALSNIITISRPVTLLANTLLSTGVGAGNIIFSGAISGAFNLGLTAGTGTVSVGGIVGVAALDPGRLTSFIVSSASTATLSSSVFTSGMQSINATTSLVLSGAIYQSATISASLSFTGPITLAQNVQFISNQGDITFSSTINGPIGGINLTVTSGVTASDPGNISFGGSIGANIDLLLITGRFVSFGPGVATVSTVGGGADTGDNIAITSDGFTLGTTTVVSAGTGTFQIRPRDAAANIEFGSTNTLGGGFAFIDADFGSITAASFTIGDSAHSGNIVWTGSTASLPYAAILRNSAAASAYVRFDADYLSTNSSLTVQSGTGGFVVAGGGSINLGSGTFFANATAQPISIETNSTITANGGINFGGTIDDTADDINTLTLNSSGITSLNGAVGSTFRLAQIVTDAAGSLTIGANITSDLMTFNDPVSISTGVIINDGTDNVASPDVTFASTVNGTNALILSGSGEKYFNQTVGNSFNLTSITQAGGSGAITFFDNVTLSAGATFNANVVLDGMTLQAGAAVTFGDAGTDQLTFSTAANTINLTAGNLIFNSLVDGSQDLALTVVGTTTFNAAVGSNFKIGDGNGASIVINAGGATTFNTGATVHTATGITQNNASGTLTFRENVTIDTNNTANQFNSTVTLYGMIFDSVANTNFGNAVGDTITLSSGTVTLNGGGTKTFIGAVSGTVALVQNTGAVTFNENVSVAGATLNANVTLAGLTFTSSADVTFGDAPADTLDFTTGAVTISTSASALLTTNATVNGNQNLTLTISGDTIFNAAVGGASVANQIGNGTGASLTISSTGATTFNSTLRTTTGISQTDGTGLLTLTGNVDIVGAGTASNFLSRVRLDGLTLTSAGAITFGSTDTDGDGANLLDGDELLISGADTTITCSTGNLLLNCQVTDNGTLFGGVATDRQSLTLTASAGAITLKGLVGSLVGGRAYLQNLTVTATTSILLGNDTIDALNINGNLSMTTSALDLRGSSIITAGTQTYTASTQIVADLHANGAWDAQNGQNINIRTPHFFINNATGATTQLSISDNVSLRNHLNAPNTGDLIFYRGRLSVSGIIVDIGGNLAIFGSAYNASDPDRSPSTTEYQYPDPSSAFTIIPLPGTRSANFAAAGLNGTTLTVNGNFYVNGTNLDGAASYNLRLPDNNSVPGMLTVGTGYGFGNGTTGKFARVYNSSITSLTVLPLVGAVGNNNVWLSAAENVMDAGINSRVAFAADRPTIVSARSIYDDMVEVIFDRDIENSNSELSAIVNSVTPSDNLRFNNAASSFQGVYIWDDSGNNVWAPGEAGSFVAINTTATSFLNSDVPTTIPLYFRTHTGLFAGVRAPVITWNTDATGASVGNALSTDRSGVQRNVLLNLALSKHRIYSALGKVTMANTGVQLNGTTFSLMAGGTGGFAGGGNQYLAAFTATTDGTRSVLVGAWAGKSNYAAGTATPYNGHNLLHIRYSEPLDLAGLSGFSDVGAATMAGNAAPGNISFRSYNDLNGIGYITETTGTVSINGLNLTYPGNFAAGARQFGAGLTHESHPDKIHLIYRSTAASATNPAGSAGLTIFLAGYSINSAGTLNWPGYLGSPTAADDTIPTITDVVGLSLVQEIATEVLDANGNQVEPSVNPYPGKVGDTVGVTAKNNATTAVNLSDISSGGAGFGVLFTDDWDTTRPAVSLDGGGPNFLIYSGLEVGNQIDRLEFVMTKPIRDSSWSFPDADASNLYDNELAAFRVGNLLDLVPTTANNLSIDSNVSPPTTLSNDNDPDDEYFKMALNPVWNSRISLFVLYDANIGFLTDHRGNLMRSRTDIGDRLEGIERTPPNIELSLGAVGGRRIYVQFDEPVFRFNGTDLEEIQASDFDIKRAGVSEGSPASVSILETSEVRTGQFGVTKAFFDLNFTIAPIDLMELRLSTAMDNVISDKSNNSILAATVYRFSNIGLGIAEPVQAIDDILNPSNVGSLAPIRTFTGNESLLGEGQILLQVKLSDNLGPSYLDQPLRLYYDVNPPSSVLSPIGGKFWFPNAIKGLLDLPNPAARVVLGSNLGAGSGLRQFGFSGKDSEFTNGAMVDFVLDMNGLSLAYTPDPQDPRLIRPWSFGIDTLVKQRAGVTILNNVINPLVNDRAILRYQLDAPANVNVMVFAADGTLVKILRTGSQAKGDYTLSWDGRNANGDVVARGLYLIRVSGGGIDEFRKVMVVK